MTFWTKRLPIISRPRTFSKFNTSDNSDFFTKHFLECMKLLFSLLVIEALTLKLRLKCANLFLRRTYLALRLFQTIKCKQKTLTKYFRYRQLFESISGDFEHSHIKQVLGLWAVDQNLNTDANSIIRQVSNKIVYTDSCQTV